MDPETSSTAIIFANGDLALDEDAGDWLRRIHEMARDALVIAADGGLRHVFALGLTPAVVVGDLDSAPNELVQIARARGAELQQHPREKAQTDLELAIDVARARGASSIRVLGAAGGRVDHAMANVLALARDELAGTDVRIVGEEYEIAVVRAGIRLDGREGDIVSLLALSDRVSGITTSGLHYALVAGTIERGSSLGVSNVMTAAVAEIQIDCGVLLVIRLPGSS